MLGASRWTSVALAIAVAGAMASCGDGGGGDDRSAIRDTVHELQAALADGDLERACGYLTEDAQKHVGDAAHDPPTTCEKDLKMIHDGLEKGVGLRSAVDRRVIRMAVDGDQASALVSTGPSGRIDVPLAKADGQWKVDALYGGIPAHMQVDNFGPTGGPAQ